MGDASKTKELVEAEGRKFFSAHVDVTSSEAPQEFAKQVIENLGNITALVNNAGIYPWVSFADTDYNTWKKVIGVNLDGTFLMSKAFVPLMIELKYGRIVNVASTTFLMNSTKMTAYIGSKGGIIGFTRAMDFVNIYGSAAPVEIQIAFDLPDADFEKIKASLIERKQIMVKEAGNGYLISRQTNPMACDVETGVCR